MSKAVLIFNSGLDFFLESSLRGKPVAYLFQDRPTLKHAFESLGLPHTEVGSASVDGRAIEVNHVLLDGDRIDLFPHPETLPAPEPDPRFLLDSHLGKLATYLRLLGFDSAYQNDAEDADLARKVAQYHRILLTRDRRLLMRKEVERGCCIRSLEPKKQISQVLKRYNLLGEISPFQRCLSCNGLLEKVDKAEVIERLEPLTKQYFDEFHRCQACGKVYWKGSHYQRMSKLIDQFSSL
jgi:uncharacterized protein